jgi:ABC-2 type transport system permease protein
MSMTPTSPVAGAHPDLGFAGILHSEWIKLRSVRSTPWLLALIAAITVGVGTQMSSSMNFDWVEGGMPLQGVQAAGVMALTSSTDLNVLVVSVLGVLVIAGEYSSGTIRSSFAAVPRRVPVLLAKALVLAVVTFVVVALATAVTIPISLAVLAGNGVDVRLDDPYYWRGVAFGVVYLALLALIAVGIGAIFRTIVSGIAIVIGFVLVLPIALGFVPGGLGQMIWLQNVTRLLPFNLGRAAYTHPGYDDFISLGAETEPPADGLWALDAWQGVLGLVSWVVVLFLVAIVALRRRDA